MTVPRADDSEGEANDDDEQCKKPKFGPGGTTLEGGVFLKTDTHRIGEIARDAVTRMGDADGALALRCAALRAKGGGGVDRCPASAAENRTRHSKSPGDE